jgi:hypothetical protein
VAGSDRKHTDWVSGCVGKPIAGVPRAGDSSDLQAEPFDWRDIHDDLFGTKLSTPTPVQLDRCPHCGITPFKEEQIHGHYLCVVCRTVTMGCCNGEAG